MNLRIAPSPTGELHLGNLYVFFSNYITSIQEEKEIILRFDDTDRKRNKSNEKNTKKILNLLGFKFSAIYIQSKRKRIYKEVIKEFLLNKFAYSCVCNEKICICERKYNFSSKSCIKIDSEKIIKLINEKNKEYFFVKNEEKYLKLNNVSFPLKIIEDFRITRSNRTFLYHFSSCVDDMFLDIEKVIRAEEWITSLWKHFLIFFVLRELKEKKIPKIEHVVLLLDKNGKKLSKREESISVNYLLKELCIEIETIKVYLYSLLVRKKNKKPYIEENELIKDIVENKEKDMILCTKENFCSIFSKNKSSPKFNLDKLLFFNKKIIQNLPFKIKEIINDFKLTKKLKNSFEINDIFLHETRNTFNTRKDFFSYFNFLDQKIDIKPILKQRNIDPENVVKVLLLHKKILKNLTEKSYLEYKNILLNNLPNKDISAFLHTLRFGLILKDKGLTIYLIINCIKESYIQKRINLFRKLI